MSTSGSQRHRGTHPQDAELFGEGNWAVLRTAVDELSWLLSRQYAPDGALKLVGDRHQLALRQRRAVASASCGDQAAESRRRRRVELGAIAGRELWIDGFNTIIIGESIRGGAVVVRGRDGALRDLASVHGTYRRVSETDEVIEQYGTLLAASGVTRVRWLFDKPVSNSGRLRARLLAVAEQHDWSWQVELVPNPDPVLAAAQDGIVIASSDGWILDRCGAWIDLPGLQWHRRAQTARMVDLS